MLMNRCFYILFFLLSSLFVKGQNLVWNSEGMDFKLANNRIQGWERSILTSMAFCTDSIMHNGRYPLLIGQERMMDMGFPLKATLEHCFCLPDADGDSLLVSITCKSRNLAKAALFISGMDKQENQLNTDTLFIHGRSDWYTFTKWISRRDAAIIHLAISVSGEVGTQGQNLWLDRIVITTEEGKILDCSKMNGSDDIYLSHKDLISLSLSVPTYFDRLTSTLKNKKIVALGESVHGTQPMNELTIQLIKNHIQYNHCKLVLLELPIEKMLSVNRYVQGDENFQLDSLRNIVRYSLMSDSMIDFFVWLKEYNRISEDKVWLLGIDYDYRISDSYIDLIDYFLMVNKVREIQDVWEMCRIMFGSKYEDKEMILQVFDSIAGCKDLLGDKEWKIVRYCLENSIRQGKSSSVRFTLRDKVMFDNLQFLSALICPSQQETVMIYSHLMHANYISSSSWDRSASFGKLAKEQFKENYLCIGLFTLQGQTLSRGSTVGSTVIRDLQMALNNSLESVLGRLMCDCFYLPVEELPSSLFYIRTSGNVYVENQLQTINPVSRMGGVIFVKQSTPVKKELDMLHLKLNPDVIYFDQCLRIRNTLNHLINNN